MKYVVIGNGKNKHGQPYSKMVPIVSFDDNEYLDLKNPQYTDKIYPLFTQLEAEFKQTKEA